MSCRCFKHDSLLQVCTGSKFPIIFRYYPDISTVKRLLVMMRITAQSSGARDCVADVLRMWAAVLASACQHNPWFASNFYHLQPLSDHNFLNTLTPQCNFLKSSDFNTEEKVIFLCCLHQFGEVGGDHHIFSNRVMINNKSWHYTIIGVFVAVVQV